MPRYEKRKTMQNSCKWFWTHERVKVKVRQPSVSKTATTHRVSTKWQPGLIKHNQADPQKTSTNTRTCTVITLWTPSGSPLESPTKWRAFNFLESGNMYLYYISTFYGPQSHPFCRGIWRVYCYSPKGLAHSRIRTTSKCNETSGLRELVSCRKTTSKCFWQSTIRPNHSSAFHMKQAKKLCPGTM